MLEKMELFSVPIDTVRERMNTASEDREIIARLSGVPSSISWNGTRPLTRSDHRVVTSG